MCSLPVIQTVILYDILDYRAAWNVCASDIDFSLRRDFFVNLRYYYQGSNGNDLERGSVAGVLQRAVQGLEPGLEQLRAVREEVSLRVAMLRGEVRG